MRAPAFAAGVASAVCLALGPTLGVGGALLEFEPRMTVAPKQAKVFAGASFQFRSSIVGAARQPKIAWSVIGPGSIDSQGLYRSPRAAATAFVVASTGDGLADSATVRTVGGPPRGASYSITTCYEDGNVTISDGRDFSTLGALALGLRAAGVAVDESAHRAVIAVDSRLVAIDLHSMSSRASLAVPGARFSEVALLAKDFIAATDNNADAGHPGVRIFRIDRRGFPVLVSSVIAGETPEGIAVANAGRTFYVSNINSNSIVGFTLDSQGRARRIATARTAARPFGIAVDEPHRLLFVADNDTATVSGARANPGLERFALTSLRRVGTIVSTGSKSSLPLGVAVDSALARVFVTNEGDRDVAVFSIPALRRIVTMPAGTTPWLPAFDSNRHLLYVPNAGSDNVSVYDARKLRPVTPAFAACAYPTSVAVVDGSHRRGM